MTNTTTTEIDFVTIKKINKSSKTADKDKDKVKPTKGNKSTIKSTNKSGLAHNNKNLSSLASNLIIL